MTAIWNLAHSVVRIESNFELKDIFNRGKTKERGFGTIANVMIADAKRILSTVQIYRKQFKYGTGEQNEYL